MVKWKEVAGSSPGTCRLPQFALFLEDNRHLQMIKKPQSILKYSNHELNRTDDEANLQHTWPVGPAAAPGIHKHQQEWRAHKPQARIMEERCGKKRKEGKDEKEKEEEKASPSHFERLPPEVVLKVLSQLKGKTLMVSIPQVCKLWRALCHDIKNVHLDFSWWKGR